MTEKMESAFLAELTAAARFRTSSAVRVGIGDDAAVLRPLCGEPVVTVDMLMDGTDFYADRLSPHLIGRKSFAVNLSDLAAMAARPIAAFVAVALPKSGVPYHQERREPIPVAILAREIMAGMETLAQSYDVAIAGGDTNTWDAPLAISVTLIGESTPHGVWRRDGARPGDMVLITGSLGGSILRHHYEFTPRVKTALSLNERYRIHAAMDVSDGLTLDLSRMAQASGVGVELNAATIPIASDAYRLSELESGTPTPLDHALGDGEDFELILAVPPEESERILTDQVTGKWAPDDPGVAIAKIGRFVERPGLWLDGTAIEPNGWVH